MRHHFAPAIPFQHRVNITIPGFFSYLFIKSLFYFFYFHNGVGVPEEKLPYIFEEFYRGDESRNKKEGNGLGLYIVKYLAGAMGGSVRAENADGFEVCLKLPISGKGEAEDNGKQ